MIHEDRWDNGGKKVKKDMRQLNEEVLNRYDGVCNSNKGYVMLSSL